MIADISRAQEAGNEVDLMGTFVPDVLSYNDYYPFGMIMPKRSGSVGSYRYGFNGMEKDDEIKGEGNSLNFKYRMDDPRLGRFFAIDPLTSRYPFLTPYQFASNSPIALIELEGLEGSLGIGGHASASNPRIEFDVDGDYIPDYNEEFYKAGTFYMVLSSMVGILSLDLSSGGHGTRLLGQMGTGMAMGDFYQATLETEKAYEAIEQCDFETAEKHLIQAGEYSKGMIFEGLGGLTMYAIGNLYKSGKAFLQVGQGSDEYLKFSINAQNEVFNIGEAGLNNGVLELDFHIPYELQGQGIGKEMFETALNVYGDEVKTIQGLWTDGTNLKLFNEALENGKTPTEAAFETVTGKWAKNNGFDKIESITPIKSRNSDEIMSVKVKFAKSKS